MPTTYLYDIYSAPARTGDMLVFNNQNPHLLKNNGSSGYVLTSNGPGQLPTWQSSSSGFITSVSDTSTVDLTVTAGNLTAAFANMNISQFTNDSGYLTSVTSYALTKTDDTNVTLTLGGTPTSALLAATSLTLGWNGQLGVTRGGTGLSSLTQGDILYSSASNTLATLAKNTSATRYLSNTGTSNNPAWAQVDLTNGVTNLLPSGNGGSDAWIDYSGTSTVTGWGSFTTKIILYRQSYKTIQVIFFLNGTSNSTSTTFTLPTASSASSYLSLTYIAVNNGTTITGCRYELPSSSSTVTCDPTSAGGSWTGSGNKLVRGEFFYKID